MSRTPDLLHPVTIAQVMVNFAAEFGVDAATCLLGTEVEESDLNNADAMMTRAQEMRLVENLILAIPDEPALGLQLGLRYNLATFGIWGFAMRTSRTVMDALEHALRYLPLSTAYCDIQLARDGDKIGVSMDPNPIPRHLRHFLLERDMATAINLIKELSLAGISLKALHWQSPEPEHAGKASELCGIQAVYEQPQNALFISQVDAAKPLPTFDPHLVRMLEDQCRQQLQRRQAGGVVGKVREQLLGKLGLVATIDEVAASLALSPRSLRRKLEAEDASFRQILEFERKQLAEQLLEGSQMTLDELAIHLGYSDTTSFTRAFRRWHGVSPGEYRRSQE